VNKLLDKKLVTFFKLDVRDNPFSFHVSNETLAKQAAFDNVDNKLQAIVTLVKQGQYGGRDKIGLRVGKGLSKYKMEKHFVLTMTDNDVTFRVDADKVAAEARLDGITIVRTSLSDDRLSTTETVRTYKSLSQVERALLSFKSLDLPIRPIRHRLENRVRGHRFLCMLAYYVEWHMKEAWRPLLFSDEEQGRKATQDPVAPAIRSESAQRKAATKKREDGTEVHSFQSLLHPLSTIVSNSCRAKGAGANGVLFEITTIPDAKQRRALDLIADIKP